MKTLVAILLLAVPGIIASKFVLPKVPTKGRISGGHYADKGQFPYQVAIMKDWYSFEDEFRCNGAIMNSRNVITSGHCCKIVNDEGADRVLVGADFIYSYSMNDDNSEEIEEIIIHPDYDPTTGMNDVCIVKLNDDLEFNSNVASIDLDYDGTNSDVGTDCTIVGYGDGDGFLEYGDASIVKESVCEESYFGFNSTMMICTDTEEVLGGDSPDYNDYGGPLVCNNHLVGIISQYKYTTEVTTYTRISAYSDWIKTNGASKIGVSFVVVLVTVLAKLMSS